MNPKLSSYARIALIVTLFSIFPLLSVHAATSGCSTGSATIGIHNPLCYSTLDAAISAILGVLINLGAVILVLFFVYAGFMFVSAQGDPKKLEKAKSAFFWTVVGGIILLGAQALSVLIQQTLQPIFSA